MIELGWTIDAEAGLPWLAQEDRYKHLLMIAPTGGGKTNFFLNLYRQEKDNGGFIILDPNGDLAGRLAGLTDPARLVYIDKDHPISLNPLTRSYLSKSANAEELIEIVNMAVVAVTSNPEITVKMRRIIRQAIEVIGEKDLSVQYLSDFLSLKEARNKHFNNKPRPPFWREFDFTGYQHDQMRMSAERIADRLTLLYESELKPFVEGENQFDIADIAKNKKAYIFNLHGLDDELTAFIGCLVTVHLKSYYLHIAKPNADPLYFYCDEFHLFLSETFQRFWTEVRKYNISCSISGHSLSQASKKLVSIVINSYAIIASKPSAEDAEVFAKNFQCRVSDILNLPRYHAIIGIDKKPIPAKLFPPIEIEPYQPTTPAEKQEVNFFTSEWMCYN